MVKVSNDPLFERKIKKIKEFSFKEKIKKQIGKIIKNPLIGKPMRNVRKGTREVYIRPFRLSYEYDETEDEIILLDVYHKDEQ